MLTPTTGITLSAYNNAVLNGNATHARLVFPVQNITLTDDNISADGGLVINSILNAETDLLMGKAVSQELVVRLINGSVFSSFDWTEEFHLDFGVDINGSTKWVTYGYFKGKKPRRTVRVQTIEFTALDRMQQFDILADEFLATITYPTTMGDIYHDLCSYMGLQYLVGDELANAMNKQYAESPFTGGISCRTLLAYIAEANCCYAKITSNGEVRLVWFHDQTGSYSLTEDDHFGAEIDEVSAPEVDAIRISCTEDDTVGSIYPISGYSVVYNIIDNPLLLALGSSARTAISTAMINRFAAFGSYTPAVIVAKGNWMVEAGDIIEVAYDNGSTIDVPVFSRSMQWDGGCSDVYECTGEADREELSNSAKEQYETGGKMAGKYSIVSGVDITDEGVTISGGKFVKINSGGVFEVRSTNLDIDSTLGYIYFKEKEDNINKQIVIGHGGLSGHTLNSIYDIGADNGNNPYCSIHFTDWGISDANRRKSVSMRLRECDFGTALGNLLCITGRTNIYNEQTQETELDNGVVNFFGNIFKGVAFYGDEVHADKVETACIDAGDSYTTLAGMITDISARSTGEIMILRFTSALTGTFFASSNNWGGVIFILKASSSNAYYLAFNRGAAAVGNISITNSEVSSKTAL